MAVRVGATSESDHVEPSLPHRRAFALGLGATGLGLGLAANTVAVPARSQTAPPTDAEVGQEARLLTNLLTRMAARITLNGAHDLTFVLDTGAERTAIAADLAAPLGLSAGPPVLIHSITSAELTPSVQIDRLDFGGVRFRDIRAPIFPRRRLGADGLLGLDVLSRFRFDLSTTTRSVALTPISEGVTVARSGRRGRLNRHSALRARRSDSGQLILIGAKADDIPVDVFVDSGAQYSIANFALRDALTGRNPAFARQAVVQVFGVTGQTLIAEPGRLRQLEIGLTRLGPTPMLFADLYAFALLGLRDRPAILIGADIMTRFRRISLDFPNNRASFEGLRRPASSDAAPYPGLAG